MSLRRYIEGIFGDDRNKILAVAAVYFAYRIWRAGEVSLSSLAVAALSTVLFFVVFFGGLFLLMWTVKRVALLFGVSLGDWDSTRSLKSFIAARKRKIARLGNGKPSARGRTQFLLGLAFGELGTRETDNDALRQSAEAFRDALPALRAVGKETKWALTQSNLAVTLLRLSQREIGTKSLVEAVEALRAAADHWEKADNKVDWADVQFHLCAVLAHLGRQQDGTERQAEAVAAGRAALGAEDNSDVPLSDARLQINLAWALACLGERETGTDSLDESIAMARASLQVIVEDKDDLLEKHEAIEWRAQQHGNLGFALRCLGERRNDADLLREAVDTLRSTTGLRTENNAHDWAVCQDELARALHALSRCVAKPDLPSDSLSASDAALGVLTRETYPFDWAIATATRANTLATLVAPTGDSTALQSAAGRLEAALAVFKQAGASVQRKRCQADLNRIQALLDANGRDGAEGAADEPLPGPMKPRPA